MSLNLDYLFKFLFSKSCINLKFWGLSFDVSSVFVARCIDNCPCSILLEDKQRFSVGEFDNLYLYIYFRSIFIANVDVYNFISVFLFYFSNLFDNNSIFAIGLIFMNFVAFRSHLEVHSLQSPNPASRPIFPFKPGPRITGRVQA